MFYIFSILFQKRFEMADINIYTITIFNEITMVSYKENKEKENGCRKKDETRREVSKQNMYCKVTYVHLLVESHIFFWLLTFLRNFRRAHNQFYSQYP